MSFEKLLYDSRRVVAEIAADTLEKHPELIEEVINLCKREYPLSMRAARAIQFYAERNNENLVPYRGKISEILLNTNIDGVKRGFLKVLILYPNISSMDNSAKIFDKCTEWALSLKETISVKAYCIEMLVKFIKEEPDLKGEVKIILDNLNCAENPALKFICRKYLKKINSL